MEGRKEGREEERYGGRGRKTGRQVRKVVV